MQPQELVKTTSLPTKDPGSPASFLRRPKVSFAPKILDMRPALANAAANHPASAEGRADLKEKSLGRKYWTSVRRRPMLLLVALPPRRAGVDHDTGRTPDAVVG